MAIRFYLANSAAPYTPATIRGSWTVTSAALAAKLATAPAGASVERGYARGSGSNEDLLSGRWISDAAITSATMDGTVTWCAAAWQTADRDTVFRVHIFVTAGDSDTVRGTLLNAQLGTTELAIGTTYTGKSDVGVSLSSVAVQAGDRLVVEFGQRKVVGASGNIFMRYGGTATPDLVAEEASNTKSPWIEFSNSAPFDSGGGGGVAATGTAAAAATTTAAATRTTPTTARASTAATATTAARKVVTATGRCTAAGHTRATARHLLAATGRATAAPTATATATSGIARPAAGRSTAGATARSATAHVTPVTGRTIAAPTTRGTTVHRAPATGTTSAAATAHAATARRTPVTARATAHAVAHGTADRPEGARAVTGRCAAAATAYRSIRRTTPRWGTGTTIRPFTGVTPRP